MQANLYINSMLVVSSSETNTFSCLDLITQIQNTQGVGTADWRYLQFSNPTMTSANINAVLNCLSSPHIQSQGLQKLEFEGFGATVTEALDEALLQSFIDEKGQLASLGFCCNDQLADPAREDLLNFAKQAIMLTP